MNTQTVYDHRDRCAIAGIGVTELSKRSGQSVLTLATRASLLAIADAGLRIADVDGLVRCDLDRVAPNDLAHSLGIEHLTFWGTTTTGGGAPCGMIGQAVAAILSGQASTVLVYRALNGRSGQRYGQSDTTDTRVGGDGSYDEYFAPWGLTTPGQMWSLIAQRHMHDFGTTSEQLGEIALACREHANRNPAAQMHDRTLTIDQYLDSRMIASPLRLYDFCLETDGACAVIVTTAERARDLAQPPVIIRAVAQGAPPQVQGGVCYPSLMRTELVSQPSAAIAETLYRRAGLGPDDIDTAQFYDCFTPTVLLQLEDYGFCGRGEGGPFAASGALRLNGRLPINTSGGNLSEGYLHGLNHVLEGARQVRGTSTGQVPNAETCLVTSGLPLISSALILRSDA
ncbi:MAG: lipid-transfer protein [Acidimicrobiia bacterium]